MANFAPPDWTRMLATAITGSQAVEFTPDSSSRSAWRAHPFEGKVWISMGYEASPALWRVRRALLLIQLGSRNWHDARDEGERQAALGGASRLAGRLFGALDQLRVAGLVLRDFPGALADVTALWRRNKAPALVECIAHISALRSSVLARNVDLTSVPPHKRTVLEPFLEGCIAGGLRWCSSLEAAEALLPGRRKLRVSIPVPGAEHDVGPADAKGVAAKRNPIAGSREAQYGGVIQGSTMESSVAAEVALATYPAHSGSARSSQWQPAPLVAEEGSYLYDEWDAALATMRRATCRIRENVAPAAEWPVAEDLFRERMHRLQATVAATEALRRPNQELHLDGDEIDIDAVVRGVCERRAGSSSPERWYRRPLPTERDGALLVLVDASASTALLTKSRSMERADLVEEDVDAVLWAPSCAGASVANQVGRRTVIDVAREITAAVLAAANASGNVAAAYAFSGSGRNHVRIDVLQGFASSFRAATMHRLARVSAGGSSRTGAALRHAHARLAVRHEHRKSLVLVTDGYPQDDDYGPDGTVEHGVSDTRHALQELSRSGVDCSLIIVDPAGYGLHKRFSGPAKVLELTDARQITSDLLPWMFQSAE